MVFERSAAAVGNRNALKEKNSRPSIRGTTGRDHQQKHAQSGSTVKSTVANVNRGVVTMLL